MGREFIILKMARMKRNISTLNSKLSTHTKPSQSSTSLTSEQS